MWVRFEDDEISEILKAFPTGIIAKKLSDLHTRTPQRLSQLSRIAMSWRLIRIQSSLVGKMALSL